MSENYSRKNGVPYAERKSAKPFTTPFFEPELPLQTQHYQCNMESEDFRKHSSEAGCTSDIALPDPGCPPRRGDNVMTFFLVGC